MKIGCLFSSFGVESKKQRSTVQCSAVQCSRMSHHSQSNASSATAAVLHTSAHTRHVPRRTRQSNSSISSSSSKSSLPFRVVRQPPPPTVSASTSVFRPLTQPCVRLDGEWIMCGGGGGGRTKSPTKVIRDSQVDLFARWQPWSSRRKLHYLRDEPPVVTFDTKDEYNYEDEDEDNEDNEDNEDEYKGTTQPRDCEKPQQRKSCCCYCSKARSRQRRRPCDSLLQHDESPRVIQSRPPPPYWRGIDALDAHAHANHLPYQMRPTAYGLFPNDASYVGFM